MFKAVMFDYGGTLVSSIGNDIMPLVTEGAKLAYAYLHKTAKNVPPFPAFFTTAAQTLQSAYLAVVATPKELEAEGVVRDVLKKLGIEITAEQFHDFAREWQKPFTARTDLTDGARECLDELKKSGVKLAIVSNNIWPQEFLEEELARLGIENYFDYIITSSKFGMKKPYAEIFEDAVQKLGVSEGETAFVGDSLKEDVVGASMVGMKTVLLDWKGETMGGVEPDARIKSLRELCGVLKKLGGE
jgi:HAD superfamily hydrolase (TIGR01662 family)